MKIFCLYTAAQMAVSLLTLSSTGSYPCASLLSQWEVLGFRSHWWQSSPVGHWSRTHDRRAQRPHRHHLLPQVQQRRRDPRIRWVTCLFLVKHLLTLLYWMHVEHKIWCREDLRMEWRLISFLSRLHGQHSSSVGCYEGVWWFRDGWFHSSYRTHPSTR